MVVAAPYCGRVVFSGGLCYTCLKMKASDDCGVSVACFLFNQVASGWWKTDSCNFLFLACMKMQRCPLPPVVVCYSALPYRDSMFHATVHLIGSGVGATPWRLASVLDPINRAANPQLSSTDLRSLVPKKSLRSTCHIEFLDTRWSVSI